MFHVPKFQRKRLRIIQRTSRILDDDMEIELIPVTASQSTSDHCSLITQVDLGNDGTESEPEQRSDGPFANSSAAKWTPSFWRRLPVFGLLQLHSLS
jgi:hypothetical protein